MNSVEWERFAPLVFVIIGLIVRYVPASILLMFDCRGGYQRFKNAPNEEIGLERAGRFYRRFGLFCIVMGSLTFILINKDYIRTFFTK
jgi:hypothetical protein